MSNIYLLKKNEILLIKNPSGKSPFWKVNESQQIEQQKLDTEDAHILKDGDQIVVGYSAGGSETFFIRNVKGEIQQKSLPRD
jgi:hypothetical protein